MQRCSPIRKHRLHLRLSVPLKETRSLPLPSANSRGRELSLPARLAEVWLLSPHPGSSVRVHAVEGYTDEVPFLQIVPHRKLIFYRSPSLKCMMQEKLRLAQNEKTSVNACVAGGPWDATQNTLRSPKENQAEQHTFRSLMRLCPRNAES